MARFGLIVTFWLVLLSLAIELNAQQAAPPGAEPDGHIRAQFVKSADLPEGIAFLATMQLLHAVNIRNSDTAVGFVRQGMQLDTSDAGEFLSLMLTKLESVNNDIANRRFNIACSSGAPKGAAPASAMLEAIDDVPEHVSAVHLHKFRGEIGPEKAKRLEQWLDSQKLQVTHVKYNRRELHRSRGEDPQALLTSICADLAATQPGDSHE